MLWGCIPNNHSWIYICYSLKQDQTRAKILSNSINVIVTTEYMFVNYRSVRSQIEVMSQINDSRIVRRVLIDVNKGRNIATTG